MSSIDKYILSEAKRYNPNVEIEKSRGFIKGKLNGTVLFKIADRYGYINSAESEQIREAMRGYELKQEESQSTEVQKEDEI